MGATDEPDLLARATAQGLSKGGDATWIFFPLPVMSFHHATDGGAQGLRWREGPWAPSAGKRRETARRGEAATRHVEGRRGDGGRGWRRLRRPNAVEEGGVAQWAGDGTRGQTVEKDAVLELVT